MIKPIQIFQESLQSVYAFLKDLRSLAQRLAQDWGRLQLTYEKVWTRMVTERDTVQFYKEIRRDWLIGEDCCCLPFSFLLCVCVCVCEGERERGGGKVSVCMCVCEREKK